MLADGTQMHQVLLNLGTNAWHALENDRGRIEIRLRGAVLDTEAAARIPGAKPGPVAWLSISDSGHGMPPGMIDRIFDPFFTTKEPGKGTGLGLSVVHGIMETHEGAIHVISTVGQGTTFHLYFPAAGPLANPRAASSSHRPPRDPRTVEPVAAPVRTAGSRG